VVSSVVVNAAVTVSAMLSTVLSVVLPPSDVVLSDDVLDSITVVSSMLLPSVVLLSVAVVSGSSPPPVVDVVSELVLFSVVVLRTSVSVSMLVAVPSSVLLTAVEASSVPLESASSVEEGDTELLTVLAESPVKMSVLLTGEAVENSVAASVVPRSDALTELEGPSELAVCAGSAADEVEMSEAVSVAACSVLFEASNEVAEGSLVAEDASVSRVVEGSTVKSNDSVEVETVDVEDSKLAVSLSPVTRVSSVAVPMKVEEFSVVEEASISELTPRSLVVDAVNSMAVVVSSESDAELTVPDVFFGPRPDSLSEEVPEAVVSGEASVDEEIPEVARSVVDVSFCVAEGWASVSEAVVVSSPEEALAEIASSLVDVVEVLAGSSVSSEDSFDVGSSEKSLVDVAVEVVVSDVSSLSVDVNSVVESKEMDNTSEDDMLGNTSTVLVPSPVRVWSSSDDADSVEVLVVAEEVEPRALSSVALSEDSVAVEVLL
jgi:hypothetical protein